VRAAAGTAVGAAGRAVHPFRSGLPRGARGVAEVRAHDHRAAGAAVGRVEMAAKAGQRATLRAPTSPQQ